jgi:hypothetical protein
MKCQNYLLNKISILTSAIILVSCGASSRNSKTETIGDNLGTVIPAFDKTKNLRLSDFYKSTNEDSSSLMHAIPSKFSIETNITCDGKSTLQTISNNPKNGGDSSDTSNEFAKIMKVSEGKDCTLVVNKISINQDEYFPKNLQLDRNLKNNGKDASKLTLTVLKDGKVTASEDAASYFNKKSKKEYYLNGASNQRDNLVLGLAEEKDQIQGSLFNFENLKLSVSGVDSEYSVSNASETRSQDKNSYAYVMPSSENADLRRIFSDKNKTLSGTPSEVATKFKVSILNKENKPFQIILRGINVANCPDTVWPLNIAGNNEKCKTTKSFVISYYSEDNKDLPAGKYIGEVKLQEFKLGTPTVSQNISISLSITQLESTE